MANLLFRDEVIEASRNRLTGAVIAAVPPSSRLYTRLVAGVAVLLLAVLLFGSYTMTADVRGVVAYDGGIARIYPRSAAEVSAIHVKGGDQVQAGQPLVTLTMAQGQGGVGGQLGQIVNQDAELGKQIAIAVDQSSSEIAALAEQRAGIVEAIGSLERQRAIAADQIRLAEAAARRAERLAKEGAGTQRQVEDSRSALLSRRAELESIGEQLITRRNALQANEAERGRRQLDVMRTQSTLLLQKAALAQQKLELSRTDKLVLTAPVAGAVGDISVEIGQQATPERAAASIIPSGSSLEVWLYAPSRAVGNARVGQEVRLQFDAFPYQKYGSSRGVVTEIAKVPTEPSNVDAGLKVDEPVFRIRTRIVQFSPRARIDVSAMRPGMTLSGKLVMERRSLWQILLGPLFEAVG
jgi:membrane fusion protein